ncbi:unnamed protein product [Orchesella dallaii]|uniref:Uncharacterized protein n=1 Tax=Orchesella dallaii TaxID=48710 RepID=A0ABP1Q814_9HEXA
MAERMKPIPANLYDRLMAQHSGSLVEVSSNQTLDSDLPDEIKAKLYQEFQRNQRGCEKAKDNIQMVFQLKKSINQSLNLCLKREGGKFRLLPQIFPLSAYPPPHYPTLQSSPVTAPIQTPGEDTWTSVSAKRVVDPIYSGMNDIKQCNANPIRELVNRDKRWIIKISDTGNLV